MLIILFFIFSSAPDYFGNMMLGEEDVARAIKGEEAKDQKEVKDLCSKLWEVEDVLQGRGEGELKELLVKWKGYEEMTWVSWAANPGLASYLIHSQASPFASPSQRKICFPMSQNVKKLWLLGGRFSISSSTVPQQLGMLGYPQLLWKSPSLGHPFKHSWERGFFMVVTSTFQDASPFHSGVSAGS